MSYHILHQFDEQWFGDSGQGENSRPDGFIMSPVRRNQEQPRASHGLWVIMILSLIVAACSLYFAMDASRQAVELQRKVTELESSLKK